MTDNVGARSLKAVLWTMIESVGITALSFVTFLVLARILEPRDFGIVALSGAFVFFANLAIGHTFSDALVQRRTLERVTTDTAFWGTVGVSLLLAGALFAGAEGLGRLVGEPEVADVLGWQALAIPLSAIGNVSAALYRRDLRFRELAFFSVVGKTAGAATGIAMAFGGWGLWSLVGQQIVGAVLTSVFTFAARPQRPGLRFSVERFRELGAYGSQVSAAQLVTGASEQFLNLLAGTLFGSTALGYLNVAWRIVQLSRTLVAGAMYHVGFSAFSRLQGDREALKQGFLKATQLSCLVGFGVAGVLIALAKPLVVVLFGETWAPAGPLLRLLALELFPGFFGMFLSACYRALDRPAIVLWMSFAYLVVGVGGAFAFEWAGIVAVVAVWAMRPFLLMPVHIRFVSGLLSMPSLLMLRSIWPLLCAAAAMMGICAAAYAALGDTLPNIVQVMVAAAAGGLAYILIVWMLAPKLLGSAFRAARTMIARV